MDLGSDDIMLRKIKVIFEKYAEISTLHTGWTRIFECLLFSCLYEVPSISCCTVCTAARHSTDTCRTPI